MESVSPPERPENNLYLTNINRKLYNLKYNNKYKNPFNFLKPMNKAQTTLNKKQLSSIDFFKNNNYKFNSNNHLLSRNLKTKSFSEANIPFDFTKINKNIQLKTINAYTYKKIKDEKKSVWEFNLEEELNQKNDDINFLNYLDKKYNFYKCKTTKERKNLKEINKRRMLFSNDRVKLDKKVEFPYKKEFFNRLNRLKAKHFKQSFI